MLVAAARAVGVRDRRVLAALAEVDRSRFVPEHRRRLARRDVPVPISFGQVTTQPSLVAVMLEALALSGGERVLEVGAGLGFQTALLGRLAGEVWSVELRPALAAAAAANLAAGGIKNAVVVLGDGSQGLPEHAPYDAIVVAAAYPRVPRPLVEQLVDGGRLVQPIGPSGAEDVTLFIRDADGRLVSERSLTQASFVALHGRHGFPLPDEEPDDGG
jgi:protein-L-isoaspartate(D-aspartate) O-methyltransferase